MKRVIFSIGIIMLGSVSLFAQTSETITVVTYYPSPYGMYNQMQANRIAVGDTNNDGQLTTADQANRDGDIRLKSQPGDPTTWSAGGVGQISYSSMNDSLVHYNGSSWVSQGGGGCYVSYSGGCLTGFTNKGSAGWWGDCYCTGYYGATPYCRSHFRPAGGVCLSGWTSLNIGEAFVCCQ